MRVAQLAGLNKVTWLLRMLAEEERLEKTRAETMKSLLTLSGILLLLAFAFFCLFGFMATFEPTDHTTYFLTFRIVYGLVGLGCAIAIGLLALNMFRK